MAEKIDRESPAANGLLSSSIASRLVEGGGESAARTLVLRVGRSCLGMAVGGHEMNLGQVQGWESP